MNEPALFLVLKLAQLHKVQQCSSYKATIHAYTYKLLYQMLLADKTANGDASLDLYLDMLHLCFLVLCEDLH